MYYYINRYCNCIVFLYFLLHCSVLLLSYPYTCTPTRMFVHKNHVYESNWLKLFEANERKIHILKTVVNICFTGTW